MGKPVDYGVSCAFDSCDNFTSLESRVYVTSRKCHVKQACELSSISYLGVSLLGYCRTVFALVSVRKLNHVHFLLALKHLQSASNYRHIKC